MNLIQELRERFPLLAIEEKFSFSAHTTIGCGGIAAAAVYPDNISEAARVLAYCKDNDIPFCFLGAGANVLPAEGCFQGIVMQFSRFRMLELKENELVSGAGVTLGELLRFAREKRVGGFEAFTGIPATVGGATAMNAGVKDCHFSDVVKRVIGIRDGEIEEFSHEECLFSEKNSVFLSGIAVAEVTFHAPSSPLWQIEQNTEMYRARRKHLPSGRSMGCTFVNPEGVSAGKLIEDCGLKGEKFGGAIVSEEHANFIINRGGTANDIAALIAKIKEKVFQKTGILLREEIRRIP
ncbi:MAG: UDP-N-acetylmuramate dehydrogenase [Clostridiales bacterium]|nr:UDP-N-acetylmuramate dehydrogenase [Clostridiales bacterium]